jgi:hypothetical protein
MKYWAAFVVFVLGSVAATAQAFPVTVIEQNGPVDRRFNIAVLGDGYRSSEQAKLTSDAKTMLDDLFDASPYSIYRGLFNIKLVQAVSNESGADNGSSGRMVDTAFDAAFNCAGVGRLLCVDDKAVLAAAARDVPEFNLAIVIVNDAKYGGSGGDVPCASTNKEATEVLRHEIAHNLAGLADEYEAPFPGFDPCPPATDCPEPNVTLKRTRAQIKWLDWIDATTQVPTTEGQGFQGVGVFEGARFLASGVYRPVEASCKMRTVGKPFCPVCTEALIRSFWNSPNVTLIDEAMPPGDVQNDRCDATTFTVKTPTLTPATLSFGWTIDAKPQSTTTSSLVIPSGALANGRHDIKVIVKDPTALVRADPKGVLQDQHAWVLNLNGCSGDASTPIDVKSIDVGRDLGGGRPDVGPPNVPDGAGPDGSDGRGGAGGSGDAGPAGAGGNATGGAAGTGLGGAAGTGLGGAAGNGTGGAGGTGMAGAGVGSGGASGKGGGSGTSGSSDRDASGGHPQDAGTSAAGSGGRSNPRATPEDAQGCACRLAMHSRGDHTSHSAVTWWILGCVAAYASRYRTRERHTRACRPATDSPIRRAFL